MAYSAGNGSSDTSNQSTWATLGSARGTAASRSLRALGVRAKRSAAERNALLQAGTARLLTDKIGRHPDDVDIALEATEALAALAEGIAPEGDPMGLSASDLSAVVCLLLVEGQGREVVMNSLGALKNMAANNTLRRRLVHDCDVAAAAPQPASRWLGDVMLQVLTVQTLAALGEGDTGATLAASGVQFLLVCNMTEMPAESELQAECCVLLSKLACDERSCRLLLECGLCETLCGSMAALWNDVMVQARGMQAMANLAEWSAACRDVLGRLNACSMVCKAVRMFFSHHDVLASGVHAMWSLGSCVRHRELLREVGAGFILPAVLTQKDLDLDTRIRTIMAMGMLGQDRGLAGLFVDYGAPQAMYRLMEEHPHEERLTMVCDEALPRLLPEAGARLEAQLEAMSSDPLTGRQSDGSLQTARNSQWDAEALHTIVFLASLMAGTQEQDEPLGSQDFGGYAEEGGYADVGDYPCAFQGDLDDDDQWAEGLDPPIDDQPVAPVPGDDALGRGGRWTGEERASTKDSTGGKGESGGGLEDDFDYLCFLDDAPATDRGHQEAEHEEAPYVDNQGSTNRAPSRHLVPPLPTSPPVPSPSSALLSPEHRSPSPLHIATSPPQPSDLAPLPLSSPKGHLAPLSPPSDLSSPLGEGPTALFVSPRSSPKSSLVSASPRVRASLPSSTPRATTVVGSPVVPPHFGSVPSLSSSKDLNKSLRSSGASSRCTLEPLSSSMNEGLDPPLGTSRDGLGTAREALTARDGLGTARDSKTTGRLSGPSPRNAPSAAGPYTLAPLER